MEEKIEIWQVGNTGLRNPNRIQEGFKAFANSPYVGNLRKENEIDFMNFLNTQGIIQNEDGKDTSGSHARKWRLMFSKNGFIYPQVKKKDGSQEKLGKVDDITPFGRNFLKADTYPAVQECYLRAQSVEQFAMPDGKSYFSPLRWILAIMLELERRTGSSEITRIEFALWGHTTNPSYSVEEVVNNILDLRARRKQAPSKRKFDEEEIDVEGNGKAFEVKGGKWKSCVTAVKGSWIRKLYLMYKDDLFSGNPRNYLGAGKRKNKINLGIMDTVQEQPENFWAYNNGLTALVNDYEIDDDNITKVHGITIINGAQSTGAIGAVESLKEDFLVPIRFIVCSDPKIIEEIINNNNKQNEILPSDLRSNDKQQVRLRKEFEKYPQLYYSGGRRDSTRVRNKEVFDPYLVAQTLLAFHGDCVTAYNSKKLIWDEDKEYTNIFSDQLTAEHIIFVYSLGRAIDEFKINLKNKKEQRTDIEDDELNFLSKRGSKMLLISAVSTCMESLLGKKILDSWRLVFKDNKNFDKLVEEWKAILDVLMPWHSTLEPAIVSGLKSKEATQNAAKQLRATLTSFSSMYAQQLKPFSDSINTEIL